MLRNKGSSSLQKTYDDCYLVCSTAVYFEGQNNEAEALRSWRSALDQIYYHNAYRVPPNYVPKNETERALQESLRRLEAQCKERVDLLEALKKSRKEAEKPKMKNVPSSGSSSSSQTWGPVPAKDVSGTPNPGISAWLSPGNVTPIVESDHTLVPPPLPQRPPLIQSESMPMQERSSSSHNTGLTASPPVSHTPPILPIPPKNTSRTPSPDKKSGRVMLTTLRGQKDSKGRPTKTSKVPFSRKNTPQASSKAAGLAWDSTSKPVAQQSNQSSRPGSFAGHLAGDPNEDRSNLRPSTTGVLDARANSMSALSEPLTGPQTPADGSSTQEPPGPRSNAITQNARSRWQADDAAYSRVGPSENPTATENASLPVEKSRIDRKAPSKPALNYPSYRTEFPPTAPTSRATAEFNARVARRDPSPQKKALPTRPKSPSRKVGPREVNGISRRPVASSSSPRLSKNQRDSDRSPTSESNEDSTGDGRKMSDKKARETRRPRKPIPVDPELASSDNGEGGDANTDEPPRTWEERVKWIRKNLPKGVDEHAAKQIFNEIVVRGDEVHWPDVAGLEAAKTALKEAVVYPFLRPDLFMGLREPARGMLLFGPPGTGKTMLARAVATESRSTFFAISASSLTSKWLGESEKLVRALFLLAKALAPSIIFVDEIDSLLSSRGGSSEHETTRRIKTEFLIQWSDLQRAAAGKEKGEGDASRVLVLAATNMPWAIDEAARRRFVRRQYIPLPEAHVRGEQLRTLLGHQKHGLNKKDIQVLVELTDGFSGSDITALAKDAAMGPLRSLGEALLYMSMDEIRSINFEDFEASLMNIRPSVNKQGLQQYEEWAKEFGERGA